MSPLEASVIAFNKRWPEVLAGIRAMRLPMKSEVEYIADESYVLAGEIGEVFGLSGEEVIKGVADGVGSVTECNQL